MNKPKTSLFLDRDGVLNQRPKESYVSTYSDFIWMPQVIDALQLLRPKFDYLLIVTNQQGIGKGLMTEQQLHGVHHHMAQRLLQDGIQIDGIYYCPDLQQKDNNCRKPNSNLAYEAQKDFPHIRFDYAVMMGDSASDLEFGRRLGMTTVWIESETDRSQAIRQDDYHFHVSSLYEAALQLDEILLHLLTEC